MFCRFVFLPVYLIRFGATMWGYLRIIRPRELSKVNRQPFLACFANEKVVHRDVRSARKKVFFFYFLGKFDLRAQVYSRSRSYLVSQLTCNSLRQQVHAQFSFPAELTKLSLGSFQLMRQYLTSCESRVVMRTVLLPSSLPWERGWLLARETRRLFSFLTLVVPSMRGWLRPVSLRFILLLIHSVSFDSVWLRRVIISRHFPSSIKHQNLTKAIFLTYRGVSRKRIDL